MAYMPDLQDKKTTAAKEPVEVSCTGCESKFRLWVPAEMLPEWERGVRISCVRCGSQYFIKKKSTGFEIKPLAAAAQTQAAPAGSPVAPAAVHEAPGMKETKAAQRTPAAVDADKETILVVEDDRLSREMVESTLTELGFRTIPAKNAAEAMTAARNTWSAVSARCRRSSVSNRVEKVVCPSQAHQIIRKRRENRSSPAVE